MYFFLCPFIYIVSVTEIKVTGIYDNASNATDALLIMQEKYGNDQGNWHVSAINLHHALLGKLKAEGVAYFDAICNSNFGFGVNGGVIGNIDDIGQGMFWDLNVFSHEVG